MLIFGFGAHASKQTESKASAATMIMNAVVKDDEATIKTANASASSNSNINSSSGSESALVAEESVAKNVVDVNDAETELDLATENHCADKGALNIFTVAQ